MPRITVFGNGFVGSAYADYFEENGYTVTRVDPLQGLYATEECYKQASIVCVPAPTLKDGSVDYSIINDIIQKIEMPVMVKSTVLPDYAECLDANVVYSPEFLTASNAAEDIRNNKDVVIGGEDTLFWSTVFKSLNKTVHTTDAKTASFMKYAVNTFLATKVVFMNQLLDQYDGDWNELKSLLKLDRRLGTSHFDVPGPDGERGFGGACFPKDVQAFLEFTSDEYLQGMSVLHKASLANRKWR
jgi:UDPglucose 6-dehydrogenase